MTFSVVLIFAIVVVFVVIVISLANASRMQRELSQTFSDLARNYGGTMTSATRLKTVFFKKDNVDFVVRGKYLKGKEVIQIYAIWHDVRFRAKFFPETLSDAMKKFIGMQDIQIGNPDFDSRFVVQSNDVVELMDFLRPEVQAAIYSLGTNAVLNISGGRAQLDREVKFSDPAMIQSVVRQFVDSYFIMCTSFVDAKTSIEVTAVSLDTTEAVCMVCGEPINDRRVVCRTCTTPHHRECWEYLGQCSTYACGQTKFRLESDQSRFHIRQ